MLGISNPFKRNTAPKIGTQEDSSKNAATKSLSKQEIQSEKDSSLEKKNIKSDNRAEASKMTNSDSSNAAVMPDNKNFDPELKELQKKLIEEDIKFLEEESKRPSIMQHLIQDVLVIAGLGGAVLGAASEFVLSKVKQEEITAGKLLKGSLTGSGIGISLFLMKDIVDTVTDNHAS